MKRISYFDNIKGMLILFVIFVHAMSLCSHYYNFDDNYFKIVFFFLLPSFILMTGYFFRKSSQTALQKAGKMFFIYLIAQTIYNLYFGLILKIVPFTFDILVARYTLWYLVVCVFLYLLSIPMKKIGFKKSFIISIVIALIVGFFPELEDVLSISRVANLLPFFILGYYAKDYKLFEQTQKYKYTFLILMIFIFVWYIFNVNFLSILLLYGKYSYQTIFQNDMEGLYKRIIVLCINIIFSGGLIAFMTKKKCFLSYLGEKTLTIYLIHGAILKTFITYKWMLNSPITGFICLYLSTLLLSLLFTYLYNYAKEKIKKKIA